MSMTSRTALLSLVSLLLITAAALAQPATDTDGAGAPPDPRKAIGIEKINVAQRLGANRHALIIGINDYADAKIPDLKFAEADAQLLYDTLTHAQIGGFKKDNVTLLTGKQATTRDVRKALSALRGVGEDDLVIVFFSGHGAKQRGETCWVTQDAEIDFLADTALTNDQLKKYLDAIPSKRLVTFIDACYAADTVINQKAVVDVGDVAKSFSGAGRVTIASAGGGQESIEAADLKQGIFTYYLVQGLKGAADSNGDGVQTLDEVWAHLNGSVAQEARKRQGIQVPTKHSLAETQSDKFLLTIDAERLLRNLQETTEIKALRERRLKTLEALYMDDKLTRDQAQLGQQLLLADLAKLDDSDRKRLSYFNQVLDGQLPTDKLQRALDLVETPGQRDARLAREAALRAEMERIERERRASEAAMVAERQRIQRVSELLDTAKANDSKEKGRTALAALEELLKLDPNHNEGKNLRNKIADYFAPRRFEFITGARTAAEAQASQKEWASYHQLTGIKYTNSLKMNLVLIPPGSFTMGSPKGVATHLSDETEHRVTLSKAFLMSATEVTQAQWMTIMNRNPSVDRGGGYVGNELPVCNVSWDDAVLFCKKLSEKEKRTYRLPTEAEWEYACRAGTTTEYHTGNGERALAEAGWYGIFDGPDPRWSRSGQSNETHPVGQKKANAWGLYDMHGNVMEWCSDWYGDYGASGVTDPAGPAQGNWRVARGGAIAIIPFEWCRSSFRRATVLKRDFSGCIGVRVVLEP